jgi:hypothetical protein
MVDEERGGAFCSDVPERKRSRGGRAVELFERRELLLRPVCRLSRLEPLPYLPFPSQYQVLLRFL